MYWDLKISKYKKFNFFLHKNIYLKKLEAVYCRYHTVPSLLRWGGGGGGGAPGFTSPPTRKAPGLGGGGTGKGKTPYCAYRVQCSAWDPQYRYS